jgi:cytochrome P450
MTSTPVEDKDLLSSELTQDPHSYFEILRHQDPVHWSEAGKAWLLTRYADVNEGYFDPRLSSDRVLPLLDVLSPSRRASLAPMLETISRWMVVTDPPAHTRLRQLANGAFRQQRVNAMGQWIGELVDGLLDEFIASGSDDFLNGIAYPRPPSRE